MFVKLCHKCGYQLSHKSKTCPWCATPVKGKKALVVFAFAAGSLILFLGSFERDRSPAPGPSEIAPRIKSIPKMQPVIPPAKIIKVETAKPIAPPKKVFNASVAKIKPVKIQPSIGSIKIYVQENIVSLHKYPSLDSPRIEKLKRGQKLTQGNRSGDWFNVSLDGDDTISGWVHTSFVGIEKPKRAKGRSQRKSFQKFQRSFDLFNTEIREAKGMAFFSDVEYFGDGVIQVTATDILLSAPQNYKRKYLLTLLNLWADLAGPASPVTVRIVDTRGHLRLEQKQS